MNASGTGALAIVPIAGTPWLWGWRPPRKAAFAVAHTLIKVIWTVLATGAPYTDLGHDFYTRRIDPQTQTRRLIAQLQALTGKQIIIADHEGDPLTS